MLTAMSMRCSRPIGTWPCGAITDPTDGRDRRWRPNRQARRPDVDFADPRVFLADMTGDGLQDIVRVNSGNVEYWPSLGNGRFGPRQRMSNSPRLRDLFTGTTQTLLVDIDGDGCADLLRLGPDGLEIYLRQIGCGAERAGGAGHAATADSGLRTHGECQRRQRRWPVVEQLSGPRGARREPDVRCRSAVSAHGCG